jgi:RNA polymerase sigma-70 factor (ECF subfamily)
MAKPDFDSFYRANLDRIYRFVSMRVPDRATAEDLVSEIFIKALNAFDRYDETLSRSAWIYRIAHNHLANWYRDRKRNVDIDDVADFLVGSDGRDLEGTTDDRAAVARVLSALDADEKRLVTMKYLEGYGYAEMAEIIGKGADALKMATHRAVKKMRGIL